MIKHSKSNGAAPQVPDPIADRQQFAHLIKALDAQARQLLGIMQQEREALATSNAEQVAACSADKRNALAALDTLELHRRQLCEETTAPGTGADMLAKLQALADHLPLLNRWQAVLSLLSECRALNRANGQLLDRQHHRITDTLALLRSGLPHKRLYGPDGITTEHACAAPLASA